MPILQKKSYETQADDIIVDLLALAEQIDKELRVEAILLYEEVYGKKTSVHDYAQLLTGEQPEVVAFREKMAHLQKKCQAIEEKACTFLKNYPLEESLLQKLAKACQRIQAAVVSFFQKGFDLLKAVCTSQEKRNSFLVNHSSSSTSLSELLKQDGLLLTDEQSQSLKKKTPPDAGLRL